MNDGTWKAVFTNVHLKTCATEFLSFLSPYLALSSYVYMAICNHLCVVISSLFTHKCLWGDGMCVSSLNLYVLAPSSPSCSSFLYVLLLSLFPLPYVYVSCSHLCVCVCVRVRGKGRVSLEWNTLVIQFSHFIGSETEIQEFRCQIHTTEKWQSKE